MAISRLLERSFVRVEKRGTRPRYTLLPAHEVPGTTVYRGRAKPKQQAEPKPDWIWLPNELIDAAADEVPPIELIRHPCQHCSY